MLQLSGNVFQVQDLGFVSLENALRQGKGLWENPIINWQSFQGAESFKAQNHPNHGYQNKQPAWAGLNLIEIGTN